MQDFERSGVPYLDPPSNSVKRNQAPLFYDITDVVADAI
jgi:hypothetical protein